MSRPVGGGLKERIDAVEAAYEFMLAYAAQGVTGEEASSSGTEIRVQLKRSDCALEGLAGLVKELVTARGLEPTQPYSYPNSDLLPPHWAYIHMLSKSSPKSLIPRLPTTTLPEPKPLNN